MILTWMLYVNKPEEGANPASRPEKTEVGTTRSRPQFN